MERPRVCIKLSFSRLHGIGVHAVRSIKKGTVLGSREVAYIKGSFCRYYTWKEYKNFDASVKKMVIEYCAGSQRGFWAPVDFDYLPATWYMNHCCQGNVGFDGNGEFVALKNIKRGGELSYDYGLVETNPKFRLNCVCGSASCRKTITGNDWKNPAFYGKRFAYMHPDSRALVKKLKYGRNSIR